MTGAARVKEAAPAPAFNLAALRERFPILAREVNGKPLVYLDNAATTQKPREVIDAISDYYGGYNANVQRGVHTLSQLATTALEEVRGKAARFINAASEQEIIFTRGTTEGINLAAAVVGQARIDAGDEIIVSEMEHHSNIVPWQMLCDRTGAVLKVIPITDSGELDLDAYHTLLGERTKLVAITQVSNALGTVNPIGEIAAAAHNAGALVLVDAAQSAPHMTLDVQVLGADLVAFSGHKMYGPTGVGVLWGRLDLLKELPPWQGGGEMIDRVSFEGTTYEEPPHRFEAGTPAIAQIIGLGAAIDFMEEIGRANIAAWEHQLLEYATERVSEIDGLTIIGTASQKAGVLAFTVEGMQPSDLGTLLDREGVAVRTGHHCAQPVMNHFGVTATTRASFAAYNTLEEVDVFVDALKGAIKAQRAALAAPTQTPAVPAESAATIQETQRAIVAEFAALKTWDERYERIIAIGRGLAELPEELKTDANKVKGCQSQVWLQADLDGDRIKLRADSDALIVRGLVSLLLRVFDGRKPGEIIGAGVGFIDEIGLSENLTLQRRNGLSAMIKQIQYYALAFKALLDRGAGGAR